MPGTILGISAFYHDTAAAYSLMERYRKLINEFKKLTGKQLTNLALINVLINPICLTWQLAFHPLITVLIQNDSCPK